MGLIVWCGLGLGFSTGRRVGLVRNVGAVVLDRLGLDILCGIPFRIYGVRNSRHNRWAWEKSGTFTERPLRNTAE